jgi:nucleotide-binding universal stress UspA family protein
MYRRILIAVDPQGLVTGAAPAVAALAAPEGAQVRLVSVHAGVDHAGPEPGEQILRRLSQELQAHRLAVQVERREESGEPVAEAIATSAAAFGADLIVIGSHRRGDVRGFFIGSVGRALAARVSTPILVVSHGPVRPPAVLRHVLVAVDGGELSNQAVLAAAALAGPQTEVTALYVDISASGLGAYPSSGLGAYPLYTDPSPADQEGARALEAAVKVLRDAGVNAVSRRAYSLDGTAAAIARTADELDTDLIVLGSRRPGNLEALLLGSVAQSVVARTRRAVLIATGARAAESSDEGPAAGPDTP